MTDKIMSEFEDILDAWLAELNALYVQDQRHGWAQHLRAAHEADKAQAVEQARAEAKVVAVGELIERMKLEPYKPYSHDFLQGHSEAFGIAQARLVELIDFRDALSPKPVPEKEVL